MGSEMRGRGNATERSIALPIVPFVARTSILVHLKALAGLTHRLFPRWPASA